MLTTDFTDAWGCSLAKTKACGRQARVMLPGGIVPLSMM
jgi:hypothetical protein